MKPLWKFAEDPDDKNNKTAFGFWGVSMDELRSKSLKPPD